MKSEEERVSQKRAEVENYRRLVKEYQSGRWMHLYLDRLKELEQELEDITNEVVASNKKLL